MYLCKIVMALFGVFGSAPVTSSPKYTVQAKPDFVSITANTSSGIVTVVGYSLKLTDVGKSITLFNSHKRPEYANRIVSLTTTIIEVIDSTHCLTAINPTENVSGVKCYIGSNNFDAIQAAFDHAYTYGMSELNLLPGTYYINPAHASANSGIRGLRVRGDLTVNGNGAVFKFGGEDVDGVDTATVKTYVGLNINGNGTRLFKDLTLEGADRTSTNIVNLYTTAIHTDQSNNVLMDLTFDNFHIKGKDGWGFGFSSSLGGLLDNGLVKQWFKTKFIDSTIEARVNPLNYFSQNGACKQIELTDVVLDGGGGHPMPNMNGVASMTSGSPILNISDSTFSFYDLTSQNSIDQRKYNIEIGAFASKIVSINSPTQAVLANNAPSDIVNQNIVFKYSGGDVSENHTVYMHPNVTYQFKNVQLNNTRKLSFRTFSSGGQSGTPLYQRLINVTENRDTSLASSGGVQCESNGVTVEWYDCDFRLSQSSVYNVWMRNTVIRAGQLYGNITAINCTGVLDHRGTAKTVKLVDCTFSSFYAWGLNSSYSINNCENHQTSFKPIIAAFSHTGGYVGYFSIHGVPGDTSSFPTIYIDGLVAKGNVIGFDLYHFIDGYNSSQKTDFVNKFTITNSTFDTSGTN